MLKLNPAAIIEKNRLSSDGVWLILLELNIAGLTEPIRVVRNNEDIFWNGVPWVAFPFELGEMNEDSKGELPNLTLKISNITGALQQYIEMSNGGVDSSAIIRVVHSKHLDLDIPEIEETFAVESLTVDVNWITVNLGPDFTTQLRVPADRYMKDFCPFKFKGCECGYNGLDESCDKTIDDCRKNKKNSVRFGGEPALPGGAYASNHQ